MSSRRGFKQRPGQALVEVTIAMLIAAMTTMSVFSVVLSATVSQGKADKREAAALILKQAQETLKSYVSVDPLITNIVPGVSPAKPGSPVSPAGAGRWYYDDYVLNGGWALGAGYHNITRLISSHPASDAFPLAGGTMSYMVTDYNCGFGSGTVGSPTGIVTGNASCKIVVFTLTYPDD